MSTHIFRAFVETLIFRDEVLHLLCHVLVFIQERTPSRVQNNEESLIESNGIYSVRFSLYKRRYPAELVKTHMFK